jgi:hypothetical protein
MDRHGTNGPELLDYFLQYGGTGGRRQLGFRTFGKNHHALNKVCRRWSGNRHLTMACLDEAPTQIYGSAADLAGIEITYGGKGADDVGKGILPA